MFLLSLSLFSLQTIDDEQDLGYGSAYYVTNDQVKEIDKALSVNSESMMKAGIYPEIWMKEKMPYLIWKNFNSLKEFYSLASKDNEAVITFLS